MMWLLAQQIGSEPQISKGYGIAAMVVIGIALLAFALLAWRDVFHIFFRQRGLGMGIGRLWAVARVAIYESWAARIWVVPILWLTVVLIINSLVVPYKEVTETVSLYAEVCLYGQMFMVLVSMVVLSCFSFGRERDRRTIITTGSKPLTRLEFMLGKIAGFSAVGLGLLLFMGLCTYGYLLVAEQSIKANAVSLYQTQEADFRAGKRQEAPDESLRNVSRSGVLTARNYIAPDQVQIAGLVEHMKGGETIRCLRGSNGSAERMVLRFPTFYTVSNDLPTLYFFFPAFRVSPNAKPGDEDRFTPLLPEQKDVKIRVVVGPTTGSTQGRFEEHEVQLAEAEQLPGLYVGTYTPQVPLLYVPANRPDLQSPIEVQVTCLSPNVYLQIQEKVDARTPSNNNVVIAQAVPGTGQINTAVPMRAPKVVGFESHDKQQIAGPSAGYRPESGMFNNGEVASFRFSQETMRKVPRDADGNARLTMMLDVDKQDNANLQTLVDVEMYEQYGGVPVRVANVPVNEKDITEVKLPLKNLKLDGAVFVDIRCAVPGHWVAVVNDAVRFELGSSPFVVNLFKSEGVIFCSVLLLVTVSVVASVKLNGWVAMLASVMAYWLGSFIPFIEKLITEGFDSMISAQDMQKLDSNWFYKSMLFLHTLSLKCVYVVSLVLPDFRHFDPTTYILNYRNMPWPELGGDLLWALWFAVPMIALGYLMMRRQELA